MVLLMMMMGPIASAAWGQPTTAAAPPITAAAFSPDGQHIIVGSQAGLHVRHFPSLELASQQEFDAMHIHAVAFSPDASRLLVAGGRPGEFGKVLQLSWPSLEVQSEYSNTLDVVHAVAWRPDGNAFLTASADHLLCSQSISDREIKTTLRDHSRSVLAVVYLPDASRFVSAGRDQTLRLWNAQTQNVERRMDQHTAGVNDLSVRPGSPPLPMIASAAQDHTVRFWQPTIGRLVRFARLDAQPLSIAWSSDGSQLVAGCSDGCLRVISPDTAKVIETIPVLEGWLHAVATHPANQREVLATGTGGQIRVVRLSDTP
jgi:WD40 repeat protein